MEIPVWYLLYAPLICQGYHIDSCITTKGTASLWWAPPPFSHKFDFFSSLFKMFLWRVGQPGNIPHWALNMRVSCTFWDSKSHYYVQPIWIMKWLSVLANCYAPQNITKVKTICLDKDKDYFLNSASALDFGQMSTLEH